MSETNKVLPEHVWVFDINRRVYPPLTDEDRANGRLWARGGPIYREHWRKFRVVGETRAYWLVEGISREEKRVKKLGALTSEQALDDDCFVNDYRHKIADHVRNVQDAGVLRQIATLVGYEVPR